MLSGKEQKPGPCIRIVVGSYVKRTQKTPEAESILREHRLLRLKLYILIDLPISIPGLKDVVIGIV